jgi:hypothetical protein
MIMISISQINRYNKVNQYYILFNNLFILNYKIIIKNNITTKK